MADPQDEMQKRILAGIAPSGDAEMQKRILGETSDFPVKSGPLDTWQRIVVQNIFDTQPKRRAAYMEKLGYEIDPKDDNKYRPLGSQHAFDMEIDPGGVGRLGQYLKKGGLKEAAQDLGDVVWDTLTGVPQEMAGQAAGAVAGLAAGPAGYLGGRAAGRATMYQAFEAVKDKIGDQLLEKDMPPDMTLRYVQTALQAAGPEIIGKGLQGGAKAAQMAVSGIGAGVRKMAGLGGGKISDTVMDAIKSNWKLFSDNKALRGASDAVQGMIDSIMGTEATQTANPRKLPATSAFGAKMRELEQAKRSVISELSSNREAMPTVQQILDPLDMQIQRLADTPGKSQEELRALDFLRKKAAQIQTDLMPKGTEQKFSADQVKVPFSVADDILTRVQDDVFDETVNAQKQLAQAARDMRLGLQNWASKFDPRYAAIKEQQAKIFDAYSAAKPVLTKSAALRTVIGGEAKGTSTDVSQRALTEAIAGIDDALGTQYSTALRTGQIQNQIYKAMEASGGARGSGGFMTLAGPAVASGLGLAASGRPLAGAGVAALGTTGAAIASNPSLSIPLIAGTQRASEFLGDQAAKIAPEAAGPVRGELMNFLSQQASREAAPGIQQKVAPNEDEMRRRLLEGVE